MPIKHVTATEPNDRRRIFTGRASETACVLIGTSNPDPLQEGPGFLLPSPKNREGRGTRRCNAAHAVRRDAPVEHWPTNPGSASSPGRLGGQEVAERPTCPSGREPHLGTTQRQRASERKRGRDTGRFPAATALQHSGSTTCRMVEGRTGADRHIERGLWVYRVTATRQSRLVHGEPSWL